MPHEFEKTMLRAGSLLVGAMLAAAGGYLDGFTYVGHGHVFANAMTANVVLLGATVFTRNWHSAVRYFPPIAAFVAAVWVSQAVQVVSSRSRTQAPFRSVLFLEISVLLVLVFLPPTTDIPFTTSIAFAASVQMQTFNKVNGRSYSSTFTTGNLRTLAEAAFTRLFRGHDREAAGTVRDFSVIVTAFLLGAVAGGGATRTFGNHALWFDIGLLILVEIVLQTGWGLPSAVRLSPRNVRQADVKHKNGARRRDGHQPSDLPV